MAAVLLLCQLLQSSCAAQRQSPPTEDGNTDLQATSWPQADRLFRSDPRWLGGDAAFSVDLGSGRVLWLFGDSFVATHAGATRRQSTFIRNSVAIQTGYDPSQATFDSYARNRHGQPVEFAPSNDSTWLWPLDGIKLGNRLLLFYMRMASDPDKNSLGFQSVGRSAFMVDNPDAEPSRWKPRLLEGPETQSKMLIGMSIIHERGFVYAFVLNDVSHDAYLLRWPSDEAVAGNLSSPQWWCGEENGWRTTRLTVGWLFIMPAVNSACNEIRAEGSSKSTASALAQPPSSFATLCALREYGASRKGSIAHPNPTNRMRSFTTGKAILSLLEQTW